MKRFLNNSEEKITKADITAILIISICYSILSFINLGNNINPNTIHKADKTKSLIIELEKTEDIIKMKSFTKYGFSDAINLILECKKFPNRSWQTKKMSIE